MRIIKYDTLELRDNRNTIISQYLDIATKDTSDILFDGGITQWYDKPNFEEKQQEILDYNSNIPEGESPQTYIDGYWLEVVEGFEDCFPQEEIDRIIEV